MKPNNKEVWLKTGYLVKMNKIIKDRYGLYMLLSFFVALLVVMFIVHSSLVFWTTALFGNTICVGISYGVKNRKTIYNDTVYTLKNFPSIRLRVEREN
jgi:cellulose synthase/poly-beta-1,6-N-acetylglucosamine synthase-like glycosyltransferase